MKAKCKRCGDTVEVTKPREFKSCKCGAIALDYGDEYYYRVCGSPEDFDGEIEDAPKVLSRATDIISEENIGGESKPMEKAAKVDLEEKYGKAVRALATKLHGYLNEAVKVKESFMDVNVDLCEDGTLWINDAKTDEQLAKFKIVEEGKMGDYKDRRTDLEKFKDFFREYGIDIEAAKIRRSYSDETEGLKQYIMFGEKAISDIHEGSVWCFDDEGNFILVEEGS